MAANATRASSSSASSRAVRKARAAVARARRREARNVLTTNVSYFHTYLAAALAVTRVLRPCGRAGCNTGVTMDKFVVPGRSASSSFFRSSVSGPRQVRLQDCRKVVSDRTAVVRP